MELRAVAVYALHQFRSCVALGRRSILANKTSVKLR